VDYANWFSVTEAAKRIKHPNGKPKSRAWVHRLIHKGELPSATMIAGVWCIDPQDVNDYISREKLKESYAS
jgi:hypothetical protein